MTSWTNLEVIKGFAEDDAEVAKYYPEDQDFLLEFEPASGDFLDNLRSVAWNQRCRSSSRGPARAWERKEVKACKQKKRGGAESTTAQGAARSREVGQESIPVDGDARY